MPMARGGATIAGDDLTAGGTGGIDQPFDFEGGVDVGIGAVAVLGLAFGVEGFEAGGDDDGADLDFLETFLLVELDGLAFTAGFEAGLFAFAGLEIEAGGRIDEHNLGSGLGKGDVDGFPLSQALVEGVGELG
jgi:hypothetical protein